MHTGQLLNTQYKLLLLNRVYRHYREFISTPEDTINRVYDSLLN